MIKKWILVTSIFSGIILLFFACSKTSDSSNKAKYVIAFSQCNGAEPWRVLFDRELKAEAEKHPDVKLLYADAQNSSSKQIADMENFILQDVNLILISPKESAPLTPIVEKAYDKEIPVIVLDRGVNSEKYTSFIGGDNFEIGKAAGIHAAKVLKGKGNIVEIWGLKGSTPAQERHDGFYEIIKTHPDIKIIMDQDGKWLRPEAKSIMETALKAHENIDMVYAHNDPMAIGAYLAAKDAGRAKEILFLGIDGNPGVEGGCQAVLDGKLSATFLYPTPGAEGLRQGLKLLQGEEIPKKITLDTETIIKKNAVKFVNR